MLRVENLSLKRGDRTILRDIAFEGKAQEIYGILGPKGAGKSSLGYAIMGCDRYKPNDGKIIFDGQEITNMPTWQRAKLGITFASGNNQHVLKGLRWGIIFCWA